MAAKPDVVATGLPSDLLENRPDVKAAELRLEASKLDTKSAKARFYPSLRLDAGIGFESFNLQHLIDPGRWPTTSPAAWWRRCSTGRRSRPTTARRTPGRSRRSSTTNARSCRRTPTCTTS
ncbi:TolC family protein [Nannocystis pusilla]|uniref:TolC family protein n=1 Tax=Nannocystis pusilla TaxID=889268 RepID=UPI003B76E64A